MYDVFKSRISAGGYKLTDIRHKIKKLYILGDLTEEQMDELLMLASAGVSTDAERPETLAMLQSLSDRVATVEAIVKALQGGNDEDNTGGDGEEIPVYPEWKPWDGISKDYQKGAVVSHNGELWESVCDVQNVWEPGVPGTESLWVKYQAPENGENVNEEVTENV